MAKRGWTDKERADFVRRFERSGKTPSAFCREHGLVHSTFSRWVKDFGKADEQTGVVPEAGPIQFVRLARRGEEDTSELVVTVGRSRIVVRCGFDAKLLRDVVAVLSDVGHEA